MHVGITWGESKALFLTLTLTLTFTLTLTLILGGISRYVGQWYASQCGSSRPSACTAG